MDTMTCEAFEAAVSDYVDGDVPPESRALAEAHLARCASCSALVVDLRRIAADARALRELAPSRDLWPGIEARIEAPVIPLGDPGVAAVSDESVSATRESSAAAAGRSRPSLGTRTWQLSTRRLAAAAAVLIAVTAGATWLLSRGESAGASDAAGSWVVTTSPAAADVQPAGVAAIEQTYDAEIRALRAVIAERRAELDPATVAIIERSLRLIDDAIAESRAALERDPANDFLHEQLDRTLARKVELMQALARMPARS